MSDPRPLMPVAPVSAPAVLFGILGLIPFVGLAALIGLGPETWYGYWLTALSYYEAVILAFIGALHWGYALKRSAFGVEAWLQHRTGTGGVALVTVPGLDRAQTAGGLPACLLRIWPYFGAS